MYLYCFVGHGVMMEPAWMVVNGGGLRRSVEVAISVLSDLNAVAPFPNNNSHDKRIEKSKSTDLY